MNDHEGIFMNTRAMGISWK